MTSTDDPAGAADNPLARRFTISSLLRFAFPTIFMMVFFGLYTIVDTMFIARFVNTNALSALNIVTPVINVIVGLGTMLAAGAFPDLHTARCAVADSFEVQTYLP